MERQEFFKTYSNNTHLIGRIFTFVVLVLLLGAPFMMGIFLHTAPDMNAFLVALTQILLVYLPSSLAEFLIYAPMLGAGGSYLAFLTGNLINLKIPCAMDACALANTKALTPENEIVSTLSIATSALTTTIVITIGVLLLIPLQPILQSPALAPAFNNVVPALFGAMAYRYYRKNMSIAAVPLILMTALMVAFPKLANSIGFLVIPSGGIAILIAYLQYKNKQKKEGN